MKTVVSALLRLFWAYTSPGEGGVWPRAGLESPGAPCHNAISMPHPSLVQTRVPQSSGQRPSALSPRPGEGRIRGRQSRGLTEKPPRPRRLQGEWDELPNSREQKQVSKPGTAARNPRSSEMKSESKWAAWNWGAAEGFPSGRHVRLAFMCLREPG